MKLELGQLDLIADKPLLLNIDMQGTKSVDWAEENAAAIEKIIQTNGALIIRGMKILSSKQFGHVLTKLFGEDLISYTYRSTPRTELRGNVYTATEYHPAQTIPQHNENAYSNRWAMRLGFCCLLPSRQGGETPLADSREVYNRIPEEIREKFARKKIMYVRNYGSIDLPWSEVFQTQDKTVVEKYCFDNHLEFEWIDDNTLRTRQVNPAIAVHPYTNELVWFNQAHLFHVSNLEQEIGQSLLAAVGVDNLPRNAFYGDGSALENDVLKVIRDVYDEVTFSFPWQKNDLILLDNMLYTHGRKPFVGERKVLVGMSREQSWETCA